MKIYLVFKKHLIKIFTIPFPYTVYLCCHIVGLRNVLKYFPVK